MDFITFVRQSMSTMMDPAMSLCAKLITRYDDLPPSSDPRILADFLYNKLNHQATKGFQTLIMVYKQMEPTNELPEELKKDQQAMLDAINEIVRLQEGDPNYRDF